jgi:hypothetical protein
MASVPPNQDPIRTQLQSIFLPHETNKIRGLYETTGFTYARFVHYTSAEAALKIIKSKRIWMRNTTCMSDFREVQHGYDIIRKFFYEGDNRERFINALEECALGVGREAIALFDQWWLDIYFNTFIAALSEHDAKEDLHGRLSMWRAFGVNTARVAIVINVPWHSEGSQALKLQFSPVAYLKEEEVYAELNRVIDNVHSSSAFLRALDPQLIINWVFYMLMIGVVCLKHEGFQEEREWRVIYSPMRQPSPLMVSSTEVINGIPQVVYKIPIDNTVSDILDDLDFARLFERLIIGPSQYHRVMHESFVVALTKAGIADAGNRVAISYIPIRT